MYVHYTCISLVVVVVSVVNEALVGNESTNQMHIVTSTKQRVLHWSSVQTGATNTASHTPADHLRHQCATRTTQLALA
jgi:hypothetical protein